MAEGRSVRLRPMTEAEFDGWRAATVLDYARTRAEADDLDEAVSRDRAERQLTELLPEGADTTGQLLRVAEDERGDRVAVVWVGPHPSVPGAAWVWDVEVEERRRGEGWGRATMLAAEQLAREPGASSLGLHVFGGNAAARGLYRSLGYAEAHVQMTKSLRPRDGVAAEA